MTADRWAICCPRLKMDLPDLKKIGEYKLFTGDPNYYKKDIAGLQAVTTADVMRVYETYIKDKPVLYTSIVPKGQSDRRARNCHRGRKN